MKYNLMWIKRPPKQINSSLYSGIGAQIYDVNFLFKNKNVYVMDNHLGAAFAWLQELDPNMTYNFYHIDKHYDLLGAGSSAMDELRNNPNVNLNEFLNLRDRYIQGCQLFRWDNYIQNIKDIYPNWFNLSTFACNEDNPGVPTNRFFINEEIPFRGIVNSTVFDNLRVAGNRWILNLDIDYFFEEIEDDAGDVIYQKCFTDAEINQICDNIIAVKNSIAVITIALSPGCCGGWKNSYEVAKLISNKLGINFQLNNIS